MRLIFVGGGLANCLIAYRLAQTRPEIDWSILEAAPELGGNHTWSFHATDLDAAQSRWIAPFIEAAWPDYEVAFPDLGRHLPLGYRSASSTLLRAVMTQTSASRCRTGVRVVAVGPTKVTLEGGEDLTADAVIDGRGDRPSRHLSVAYQKFLGLELRTREPHGVVRPILMDATVPQRDGYRFVYTLPLGPDRLLVEDTYYSDNPDFDAAATRTLIEHYVGARNWTVAATLREERGVLPIALGGNIEALWAEAASVPRSGMRAALFHPTTGYSLPWAARLADHIAMMNDLDAPALFAATRSFSIRAWKDARFYRLLNRLLFMAAKPDERYRLMQRFYRLPPGLIARFYAGQSTLTDKLRVLTGKPPVPLARALRCLSDSAEATASASVRP